MSKIFKFIPIAFDYLFKALGIHDKTKRMLIIVLVIAILEAPLATLQCINIWQRVKYQQPKPLPNVFPGGEMMGQEDKIHYNIDKLAVKEALNEWLDKKWDETCMQFGRWSIRALGLLAFGAFVYLLLWANGWHK